MLMGFTVMPVGRLHQYHDLKSLMCLFQTLQIFSGLHVQQFLKSLVPGLDEETLKKVCQWGTTGKQLFVEYTNKELENFLLKTLSTRCKSLSKVLSKVCSKRESGQWSFEIFLFGSESLSWS